MNKVTRKLKLTNWNKTMLKYKSYRLLNGTKNSCLWKCHRWVWYLSIEWCFEGQVYRFYMAILRITGRFWVLNPYDAELWLFWDSSTIMCQWIRSGNVQNTGFQLENTVTLCLYLLLQPPSQHHHDKDFSPQTIHVWDRHVFESCRHFTEFSETNAYNLYRRCWKVKKKKK